MMVFRTQRYVLPFSAALWAFFFLSCTEFFSTSLAPWAARDPASLIPPVTADNVDDLIAQAENNPDMSLALLKKIRDARNSASGAELGKLQAAALEAAVNATGLGNSLLTAVGELGGLEDPDKAGELARNAINRMSNLAEAGELLNEILPRPGGDPAEFQAFTEHTGSEDLVMSAVVLLAAESQKHDDGYIENFDANKPLTPSEQLPVDLAKAALEKIGEEGGQGPLGDILSGLNLSSDAASPLIPAGGPDGPVI
jgi:hypothetical protein